VYALLYPKDSVTNLDVSINNFLQQSDAALDADEVAPFDCFLCHWRLDRPIGLWFRLCYPS